MSEEFRTPTGRLVTDEEIQQYVVEAEQGYDVAAMPRRPGGFQPRALTDDQIRHMRRMYAEGASVRALGNLFGVSSSVAHKAVRGVTYKDVPDEEGNVPAQVISMNTHPLRGTVLADEREALIVAAEPCTLCGALKGQRCRVYQSGAKGWPGSKPPEIGKERTPHSRRVRLAQRHGIL